MSEIVRKIVCIGGGEMPRVKNGVVLPYETKEIDEEIVKMAGKSCPKVLFVGTASFDKSSHYEAFRKVYEKLGCVVTDLKLCESCLSEAEMRERVFGADVVYIDGGKTEFMLERWRECGFDRILMEAYGKGVVLAGVSAGSYCWFRYNYDSIEGLGLIEMINCAHYNQKSVAQKEKFYRIIADKGLDGLAIDDCVAVAFVDGEMRVIKSDARRKAYLVSVEDGELIEKELG